MASRAAYTFASPQAQRHLVDVLRRPGHAHEPLLLPCPRIQNSLRRLQGGPPFLLHLSPSLQQLSVTTKTASACVSGSISHRQGNAPSDSRTDPTGTPREGDYGPSRQNESCNSSRDGSESRPTYLPSSLASTVCRNPLDLSLASH